jgi:hypothetical protein
MTHNKIERVYDVGIEWEYKALSATALVLIGPLEDQLNILGENGWNLILVYNDLFVFKRPKR